MLAVHLALFLQSLLQGRPGTGQDIFFLRMFLVHLNVETMSRGK